MKSQKLRSVLINIGVLFAFSLIAFGIGEFITRAMYKDRITLFPRYHTYAQYGDFTIRRIRPNSTFWHTSPDGSWRFQTNAQGFRNYTDFDYDKDPRKLRVIALGDSHTQGYEVRQDFTYSSVIEKYLRKNGHDAEVINTGVSGFSTAEALVFLENEGIKYQPDVVVLGFFANDYEDNIKAGLFRLHDSGELLVEKFEHAPGVRIQNIIYSVPFVSWLGENSYFYSALFNAAWMFAKNALAEDAAGQVAEYAVASGDPVSDYQMELTTALLERLHKFCQERGIPLVIIDIPQYSTDSIVSSLDDKTLTRIEEYSDRFVSSTELLAPYGGVAEIHRPRGQVHISEFTHAVLGVEAAREIDRIISSD